LWQTNDGSSVGPPLAGYFHAFTVDGRLLATTDHKQTWLWETASGKAVGPPRPGDAMGLAPDGRILATADEKHLWVWPVPAACPPCPLERLRVWLEALTAMELGADDVLRPLAADVWRERRVRLEQLGGPPLP
jgi:hypothetical protein